MRQIGQRLGDPRLQACATVRLASALYHQGRAEAAIAELQPWCDATWHGAADPEDAALRRAALNNLANARLSTGELAAAHAAWQACDAQLDDPADAARVPCLHNLALVAHCEGRHAEAAALSARTEACEAAAAEALAAARAVVRQGQRAAWQPVCAAHDGKLALLNGQPGRAQALLQRALDLGRERGLDQGDLWDTLAGEPCPVAARLALAGRQAAPPAVAPGLARLVTRFGSSWRLEHARTVEAAAAWLLLRGRAAAAARAWRQAQALRAALKRQPSALADDAPATADAPLAWLLPHLD